MTASLLSCRRFAATLLAALGLAPPAAGMPSAAEPRAQAAAALPFYTPGHFVQGLYRHGKAPAAAMFAQRAAALAPAVQRLCEADAGKAALEAGAALGDARVRWAGAVEAWERLAAVAVGPLIERRSLSMLDFAPARPALIARAIEAAPGGAAEMEKIGAPAKGLPALEWLLWTQPVAPGTPACRYAAEVAADLGREAALLAAAVEARAASDWDGEAASAAMAEAVNQWLGGLERLRWQDIERPLRAALDTGRAAPAFPRAASAHSAASWAAQWQGLRALALQPPGPPPNPGEGLVTIETYLRGRGQGTQADALRRAVRDADPAMQDLSAQASGRLLDAARALAAIERVVEAQVAPALEISIGFSDADGD